MVQLGTMTPISVLKSLVAQYGVSPAYRGRLNTRLWTSRIIEPFRLYENFYFKSRLAQVEVHDEPLIILGFGRSGTTHLHNCFWKDPQFGVVSNYLAAAYPIALTMRSWLPWVLEKLSPETRPIDNVAVIMESGQEEEVAMMNMTEHTGMHAMSFPAGLPGIYAKYTSDLENHPDLKAGWREAYWQVMKKATFLSDGKRLVLKSPPATARIKVMLEIFPNAKFVHIVRSPYRVYRSMRNMYDIMCPEECLNIYDYEKNDRWILQAYKASMQNYLAQRSLIPSGNLYEITYEDLDADGLAAIADMYERLGLPGWSAAKPHLETYLNTLGTFKKNNFDFPPDLIAKVNEHWAFAFEAWGYEMRAS